VAATSHVRNSNGILRIRQRKSRSDCIADAILVVGHTADIVSRSHDADDNVETGAESFCAIDERD
jgi:hypothetical protein